ncbi:uncharacterized protein TRIADDRAFT_55673 [Trichoplax adhaerens]|uniref:Transmembrane protein 188 n=1 Tax=Trichoplax adhaerens TaxID=10228 RepID=B3RVJ3_TRIAD|nr:hypothetical protein TRIADDRAFT_55673 [Trichoplax adhaerens]EDV25510.1 hypothetical protein TRIADDRAFT_55673 [Trichoplax adhaerens]|eukprot:XP_002111543.1 hypothetical protein TRIADDRAFT_55673 [Trichoplax adhaerens]
MDLDPAQQAEDLKAFEGRLVESIGSLGPTAVRWKCILILCVSCCFISGYAFIMDIHTAKFMTCTDLFLNHKFFTMCCIILVSLLATGVQQRIMAQTMYPFSLRLL